MSGVLGMTLASCGAPGVLQALPNSGSTTGTATWQLLNDGTYSVSVGAGSTTGDWIKPASSAVAAFYQVKVDVTGGSMTTGTTGSYVDLSSTQTWTKVGASTVTFTATIREKATGIVRLTQAGITMTVV